VKVSACLRASSALIDPCTYTYYLTVYTINEHNKEEPIMEEILHHSNCDIVFKDKHVATNGLEKWMNRECR